MWFYVLLGIVVAGLLVAAFLDRKAKKARGELKPVTIDREPKFEAGAPRIENMPVVPHGDS